MEREGRAQAGIYPEVYNIMRDLALGLYVHLHLLVFPPDDFIKLAAADLGLTSIQKITRKRAQSQHTNNPEVYHSQVSLE